MAIKLADKDLNINFDFCLKLLLVSKVTPDDGIGQQIHPLSFFDDYLIPIGFADE